MIRRDANNLAQRLYEAGFDVSIEIKHPLDHPNVKETPTEPVCTVVIDSAPADQTFKMLAEIDQQMAAYAQFTGVITNLRWT